MPVAEAAALRGVELSDARWHLLYRVAAAAALITVVFFLYQIIAFFVWPPPSDVGGHFALLQTHRWVGLVSLDFLIVVDEVLFIPVCLALYLSLRRVDPSLTLLGTALCVVSLLCYVIATPALNMLYLSQLHAAATSATEREQLLAAGQAVLSFWQGTPYQVGYVVGSLGMILVSWVMLGSKSYDKAAGYTGIVANLVAFLLYVPKVGVLLSILSVVGLQVWYVMIARTLWKLAKEDAAAPSSEFSSNTSTPLP